MIIKINLYFIDNIKNQRLSIYKLYDTLIKY